MLFISSIILTNLAKPGQGLLKKMERSSTCLSRYIMEIKSIVRGHWSLLIMAWIFPKWSSGARMCILPYIFKKILKWA